MDSWENCWDRMKVAWWRWRYSDGADEVPEHHPVPQAEEQPAAAAAESKPEDN